MIGMPSSGISSGVSILTQLSLENFSSDKVLKMQI